MLLSYDFFEFLTKRYIPYTNSNPAQNGKLLGINPRPVATKYPPTIIKNTAQNLELPQQQHTFLASDLFFILSLPSLLLNLNVCFMELEDLKIPR